MFHCHLDTTIIFPQAVSQLYLRLMERPLLRLLDAEGVERTSAMMDATIAMQIGQKRQRSPELSHKPIELRMLKKKSGDTPNGS